MRTNLQATVDDTEDFVQWSRVKMDGNVAMKIGSQKQVSTSVRLRSRQYESSGSA